MIGKHKKVYLPTKIIDILEFEVTRSTYTSLQVYTCDICGKNKKFTEWNREIENALFPIKYTTCPTLDAFCYAHFKEVKRPKQKYKFLCSARCINEVIAQNIDKITPNLVLNRISEFFNGFDS